MNAAASREAGSSNAKTLAKWAAVVTAAACVLQIGVYLASPAKGPMSWGIVFPVALLFLVGGQFVANSKALADSVSFHAIVDRTFSPSGTRG
jgi:branched-subunit amino acid permease